jgi:osmotically-inducible protein OsmY
MFVGTIDNRNWSAVRNHAEEPQSPPRQQTAGPRNLLRRQFNAAAPAGNSSPQETGHGAKHRDDDKTEMADDRIVDLVYEALKASGYGQLRALQVHSDDGRVTLQGRLPTYYLKQVAQLLVGSVPGVRDIDNDVKVLSPERG